MVRTVASRRVAGLRRFGGFAAQVQAGDVRLARRRRRLPAVLALELRPLLRG